MELESTWCRVQVLGFMFSGLRVKGLGLRAEG